MKNQIFHPNFHTALLWKNHLDYAVKSYGENPKGYENLESKWGMSSYIDHAVNVALVGATYYEYWQKLDPTAQEVLAKL